MDQRGPSMSFAEFRRRAQGVATGQGGPAAPAVVAPRARVEIVREDARAPVVFARTGGGASADAWLRENVPLVESALNQAGAALLRGFEVVTPDALEAAIRVLDGAPMSYRENTSPRTTLKGEIKTSTDHPAEQAIELHSEQSYSRLFPLRLYLACARPATEGGETPIADTRRVLAALPPALVARLAEEGYLYRRVFRPDFGPSWQETYRLEERVALEAHLAWAGIAWSWDETGILRTEIRRSAVARHLRTGECAWFNHVLFWHHSSLEPELAAELMKLFGEAELPHAVFHGDGSSFEADEIATIRAAHRAETWPHAWRTGDLLVLDNVLRAHGRGPYRGPRTIMFAMARPVDAAEAKVGWMAPAARAAEREDRPA